MAGKPQGLGWAIAKGLVYKKSAQAYRKVRRQAPLLREQRRAVSKINWFFDFCGVEILEGYGMTESSAATCGTSRASVVLAPSVLRSPGWR